MLDKNRHTSLPEQSQYKYSLQSVGEPNLYREIYPYDEVPKIAALYPEITIDKWYAAPCSMLRACVMLLSYIGYQDRADRLERALDICTFEEKRLVITGRAGGATCREFGDYVMETLKNLE
ncbi:MAG: hypothetical protein J6V80_02805 [Clostridia bacterium]|nr:hypothetical protein [Clostridia bacterium]